MPLALAPALKTLLAILVLLPLGLVGLAILAVAVMLVAVLAGAAAMWALRTASARLLSPSIVPHR